MRRRDDAIRREDRRITTRQQALSISVNKESVSRIIRSPGYSTVCARMFARSVTAEHKTEREAIYSELLARFEAEGRAFLSRIITAY